ncbi:hypothetical protein RvY_12615 [Ramazzottius varieornatus]|uniref:Uncharacterized protein n=1 Tax=Ramazzottius varieornatus TaxID=947166 RepID=A0A1D1VME1_RAMVA|nr:hypothetical protein RvY_12615 [Ramazzottius varieornatus]
MMVPWKHGKELAWDVTIVDTMVKSYVWKEEKVGNPAEDREGRKVQKCHNIGSQ